MNQEKIGDFIRTLRKAKGMSQQEVADALMVTQKTVSRWENGEGVPDISIISEVAHFFDVTVDELLDGERKNKEQSINTNKRKELNRSKLCLKQLTGIFNLFISIPLASYLLLTFVATIVLFTTGNEVVTLFILLFSAVASLIAFIVGYNIIKNKINEVDDNDKIDVNFIKYEIKKKTILFTDCYVGLFLVSLLMVWFMLYINGSFNVPTNKVSSNVVLLFALGVIYLIIRPLLKEQKLDLVKLKNKLPLVFTVLMIIPTLFIFEHIIDVYYDHNIGNNITTTGVTAVINIGLFFQFDFLSKFIFTIIGAVMLVISLILVIVFLKKDQKKLFIFMPILFISTLIPVLDYSFFTLHNVSIHTIVDVVSVLSLLVCVGLIITYIVLNKKLKKENI